MMEASQDLKSKLLNASIIFMFALPLFPSKIKPLVIAFFGFIVLFNHTKKTFHFDYKSFLFNSSIYLLMMLSLLYSKNLDYGFSKLETMASLAVFPLIFSIFPKHHLKGIKKNLHSYILIYYLAVLIFNLISFIYHSIHYGETIFIHYPTVNRIAQGGYNIHPIYLSIHICVALVFSFFLLKKYNSNFYRVLILISNILLLSFLFILLKKGPILVFLSITLIFALFQRNRKVLVIALFFIVLNVLAILSFDSYRNKFKELIKIENINDGGLTSTNIRYTIYNIAVEKIIESPIIGYGMGDSKDVLLETYKSESPELYQNKYNSHNQYISFALGMGVIGLIFFLIFMITKLIYAIRFNNQILILLILLYGMMMTFENILEREDAVIYFSFFLSFFSLLSTKKVIYKTSINEIIKS